MDSSSGSATGLMTGIGSNPFAFTGDIIPPSSKGVRIIIMDVFLMLLAIVFTVLRIISRQLRGQKLFPEDYLHIVSLVGRTWSILSKHGFSDRNCLNRSASKASAALVLQVSQVKRKGVLSDLIVALVFARGFGHPIWQLQIYHITTLIEVSVPQSGALITSIHRLAP